MLGVNQKTPIDGVVREHLACASQFLGALRAGAFQPQSRDHFEDLSRRCEANLDALRIAGDKAIALGRAAMGDDSETAAVIALLLAECESGQPAASELGVQLLRHETPEIRQAAWWGLRLASSRHVEPHLLALAERDKWEFAPAAALDILAFHRLPVPVGLGPLLDSDSDEIAWLLAEAGGRIQDAWNRTHLKQFISRGSSRVREAALRASARCGLPELAGFCRAVASEIEPMAPEVVEFLGVKIEC